MSLLPLLSASRCDAKGSGGGGSVTVRRAGMGMRMGPADGFFVVRWLRGSGVPDALSRPGLRKVESD